MNDDGSRRKCLSTPSYLCKNSISQVDDEVFQGSSSMRLYAVTSSGRGRSQKEAGKPLAVGDKHMSRFRDKLVIAPESILCGGVRGFVLQSLSSARIA